MSEAPKGFDVAGLARDVDQFARDWDPVLSQEGVSENVRLCVRNPELHAEIRQAIDLVLTRHPKQAVSLAEPVPQPKAKQHA